LSSQVNWNEEQACFHDFMLELASYYSPRYLQDLPEQDDSAMDEDHDGLRVTKTEIQHQQYQIQHVLFPAFMKYARPSKELIDNEEIRQLANLPDMYKIFERC
jgi:DNA mismatch repair protein MLH1